MIYSINGERCTSSSRLLIHENIKEAFEARLIERVNNIKVGHPLDPATEIGPLISEEHFAKVTSYFEIAKSDGAKLADRHPCGDVHQCGRLQMLPISGGLNLIGKIAKVFRPANGRF